MKMINQILSEDMEVGVYRNLHKQIFSVICRKTGRVIAHRTEVSLKNVKFHVRQGGRNKVVQTKSKNVHAFVYGNISLEPLGEGELIEITYNPYRMGSFFRKDSLEPVYSVDRAILVNGKQIFAKIDKCLDLD